MAEETPQEQQQPVQGQFSMGPCQRCNKEIQYWHPEAEFLNGMKTSSIAILHLPTKCPHCGLRFVTQVLGMNGLNFRWVPIPDKDAYLGDDAGEKAPTIVTPGQRPKGLVRKNSGLIIPG